jgi:hypothetical protein
MRYIEPRLISLYFKFNNSLVTLTCFASTTGNSIFVLNASTLDGLTSILMSDAVISNPKSLYSSAYTISRGFIVGNNILF